MPTSPARFRISIKDQHTHTGLKVELIDAPGVWGERRYKIRLNGKPAAKVPEATLSEVFNRLRRWVVSRAETRTPVGSAVPRRAAGKAAPSVYDGDRPRGLSR